MFQLTLFSFSLYKVLNSFDVRLIQKQNIFSSIDSRIVDKPIFYLYACQKSSLLIGKKYFCKNSYCLFTSLQLQKECPHVQMTNKYVKWFFGIDLELTSPHQKLSKISFNTRLKQTQDWMVKDYKENWND